MNTYVWLFRREFWENRSIWLVPVAVGGFLLLAAVFGQVQIGGLPIDIPSDKAHLVGATTLFGIGVVLINVMLIYTTWYFLDCLHADRRDRSILFWKSLPITDTDTVLSKLAMGALIIPVVYFVIADVLTLATAFVISVRAGSTVVNELWSATTWTQLQIFWVYAIVTQALWFLPFTGWLMLVSAWARRAPMLWSLLPPLIVVVLERRILGTNQLGHLMWNRIVGYFPTAFQFSKGTVMDRSQGLLTPFAAQQFLTSELMWGGVIVGASFIAGAIALRRYRSEMI